QRRGDSVGTSEEARYRLTVEIAAADDSAAAGRDRRLVGNATAWEDERVVGRRVELDVGAAPEMVERVADRAVDLRRAAQRVRVLDLVGVAVMAGLERAPAQDVAQLGGDRDLPRVRAGELIGRRERDI